MRNAEISARKYQGSTEVKYQLKRAFGSGDNQRNRGEKIDEKEEQGFTKREGHIRAKLCLSTRDRGREFRRISSLRHSNRGNDYHPTDNNKNNNVLN